VDAHDLHVLIHGTQMEAIESKPYPSPHIRQFLGSGHDIHPGGQRYTTLLTTEKLPSFNLLITCESAPPNSFLNKVEIVFDPTTLAIS